MVDKEEKTFIAVARLTQVGLFLQSRGSYEANPVALKLAVILSHPKHFKGENRNKRA